MIVLFAFCNLETIKPRKKNWLLNFPHRPPPPPIYAYIILLCIVSAIQRMSKTDLKNVEMPI